MAACCLAAVGEGCSPARATPLQAALAPLRGASFAILSPFRGEGRQTIALLLGAALVALANPAFAQTPVAQPTTVEPTSAPTAPTTAEPSLEDLIPDGAVANPEAWVRQAPAASTATQDDVLALDPASPLTPLPELQLAWPDDQDLPARQERRRFCGACRRQAFACCSVSKSGGVSSRERMRSRCRRRKAPLA